MMTKAEIEEIAASGTIQYGRDEWPLISIAERDNLTDTALELLAENKALREALEKIRESGTRNRVERVGDAYREEGWKEYVEISEEAEIASATLAGAGKEGADGTG